MVFSYMVFCWYRYCCQPYLWLVRVAVAPAANSTSPSHLLPKWAGTCQCQHVYSSLKRAGEFSKSVRNRGEAALLLCCCSSGYLLELKEHLKNCWMDNRNSLLLYFFSLSTWTTLVNTPAPTHSTKLSGYLLWMGLILKLNYTTWLGMGYLLALRATITRKQHQWAETEQDWMLYCSTRMVHEGHNTRWGELTTKSWDTCSLFCTYSFAVLFIETCLWLVCTCTKRGFSKLVEMYLCGSLCTIQRSGTSIKTQGWLDLFGLGWVDKVQGTCKCEQELVG